MFRKRTPQEVALIAIIIAVAGLLGITTILSLRSPAKVPEIPLQTLLFDSDGGKLEILGVSVDERVVESPARNRLPRLFKSRGMSHYVLGDFGVTRETENGEVVRTRSSFDGANALLIELRLTDPDGMPVPLPSYLATKSKVVFLDHRLTVGIGPSVRYFTPADDSVEAVRAAMGTADLQLVVQHHDPVAGWVHLNGPYLFNEDGKDRVMVALPDWQRDVPTLDFRAIRADGSVVMFSLPNPDFKH